MDFVVAEECLRLGLRAGAVVFRDVTVAMSPPDLRSEIEQEARAVWERFADAGRLDRDSVPH